MIRKLLATTAVAALIASTPAAFAQDTDTTNPDMSGTAIFNRDDSMSLNSSLETGGYITAKGDEILASSILGKSIYNGPNADSEVIGDVNDVLMTPEGQAQAVIVGVGGFLGIGEKEVAIDFSRVSWADVESERRLIISATAEELENAPAFDRTGLDSYNNNMMTDMGATDTGMDKADDDKTNANADINAADPAGLTDNNDTGMAEDMSEPTMFGSEQTTLVVVDPGTLSADELIGTPVYDGNDKNMGEVSDVILASDSDTIEAYIVDIGGFLGIGEKPVALAVDQLDIGADENGSLSIHTGLTQEELESRPTYSEEAYREDPDLVLAR